MARGFLKLCGAALIFIAGWKEKEKADDMFGVPKPATVLAKVTQFWDDISAAGATEKKPLTMQQVEELIRRERDVMKAEFRETQKQAMVAALEEINGSYARPHPRSS